MTLTTDRFPRTYRNFPLDNGRVRKYDDPKKKKKSDKKKKRK